MGGHGARVGRQVWWQVRLSRNGIAVFASTDTFQGNPDGSVHVLRPGRATEAGCLADELVALNCPVNPARPDGPWHTVSLDGRELLAGSWPYMRCGGGVVAGSGNSFGQIRWADGTLQDFTGRLVGVSNEGIVSLTSQDHTALSFWASGRQIASFDPGGVIRQSNAQESDQLDQQLVNSWLTVGVGVTTRLVNFIDMQTPIGYLPNEYARTVIPLDNGTLVEWDGKRTTWRPHDSRNGLVLLDTNADTFYLDAVDADGTLVLVWSAGAGQLRSDFQVKTVKDFESLPRVDVITRPTQSGYPYTALPLPIGLGIYMRDHAPDSHGAPFATPPDLPYGYCFPQTIGEVSMAVAAGVGGVSGSGSPAIQPSQIPLAFLAAIGCREDAGGGPTLEQQIDTAIPQCVALSKPLLCYIDSLNPVYPANLPTWAVRSMQVFYQFGESPIDFVTRVLPAIKSVADTGPVDIAFSAFDRNLPNWPTGLLATLQSCAGELCRREPRIVSVSMFNGGRWGILP